MRERAYWGLFLGGDITGSGEDAEDVAPYVFVHRGVIQNVGKFAVTVTDGEGIVGDIALGQDLLVAFPRLLRLGKVVGEVVTDKSLPGDAGNPYGGFIDVGDSAVRADSDQGVE